MPKTKCFSTTTESRWMICHAVWGHSSRERKNVTSRFVRTNRYPIRRSSRRCVPLLRQELPTSIWPMRMSVSHKLVSANSGDADMASATKALEREIGDHEQFLDAVVSAAQAVKDSAQSWAELASKVEADAPDKNRKAAKLRQHLESQRDQAK